MTQQTNAQPQGGAPAPNQPTPAQPGSPEYAAQMAALYDGQTKVPEVPPLKAGQPDASTGAKAEKPSWLPDKFWDAEKGEARYEDLAKSYGELEKIRSQGKTGEPGAKPDDAKKGDEKSADGGEGQKPAPINFESLQSELIAGGLTEDSRKALTGLGLPEEIVSAAEAAFKAQGEFLKMQMAAHLAGDSSFKEGQTKLEALLEWGQKNLSDGEKAMLDTQINAGEWQAALDFVAFKQSKSPAAQPRIVTGGSPSAGEAGFTSQSEMMKAIMDPRYAQDPVYRRSVEQRIAISNFR